MAKILVVDDEKSLRELLESLLEELGHEVLSAANGEQALKIVETDRPALVISDVMMPVMDGYSLLEQIRLNPQWRSIKVLMISAVYIQRQSPYQADDYLSKPYDFDMLEVAVDQLLA